jgi:hypothetical protein
MSEPEIEEYIADLGRRLHGGRSRGRILDEARDHLLDATEQATTEGLDRTDAARRAIAQFGPADTLAAQFNAQEATAALRRFVPAAGALGVVVIAGFVLAVVALRIPHTQRTVPLATLIAMHVGLLALQVAGTAGLILGARIVARWRAPAMPVADRRLIGRGLAVYVVALGVAALAWAVSVVVRSATEGGSRTSLLVGGTAVMLLAAAVAGGVQRRLRSLPLDESDAADGPRATGLTTVGERVLDWVAAHPAVSCTAVAIAAAAGAMTRAESSLPVDLMWAAGEAACVVVAFVTLGPLLGITRPGGKGSADAEAAGGG